MDGISVFNKINEKYLTDLVTTYGMKLITAVVVFLIGMKIIKYLVKIIEKAVKKSKVDKSLESFILSVTRIALKILLFITVIGMAGVETTSFVAIIGSAGLAVGLALQGSLANFAGGVLILLLKPFKLGDYIEVAGYAGTVEEIQVFYTTLKTPDNRMILIPNGSLSNASAVNYSAMPTRRVDLVFGVGYEEDVNRVKSVLKDIMQNHKLILDDPEPFIRVGEHGESSVNFVVRVWCKSEDYWTVYYDLLEIVKIRFDEEGINIPYPHMDVMLKK
ncbi:mechanosensitive ion channel [Clostridium aestuarii]|uniref:Mechanosensitive ion channel n=1 Tax=Clostridium aestuarii TaxID=338193 RepID=A0ABT4CV73_9CLOT|nr:mechanosensitive ion channel domain-containing protein [Clostridium aestuarii]MCY6482866.1 mechanosensitive ion channel [Clostridium aestuarii]